MDTHTRPLAIVTGASSGIGYELATLCAKNGFDLVIAADEPEIMSAAESFRALGATVEPVQVDLAVREGVDQVYAAAQGRPGALRLPLSAGAGTPVGGVYWLPRRGAESAVRRSQPSGLCSGPWRTGDIQQRDHHRGSDRDH